MIYSKDVKMKQTAVLDCHRTLFVHVAPPSPSHTHTHTHTHARASFISVCQLHFRSTHSKISNFTMMQSNIYIYNKI